MIELEPSWEVREYEDGNIVCVHPNYHGLSLWVNTNENVIALHFGSNSWSMAGACEEILEGMTYQDAMHRAQEMADYWRLPREADEYVIARDAPRSWKSPKE